MKFSQYVLVGTAIFLGVLFSLRTSEIAQEFGRISLNGAELLVEVARDENSFARGLSGREREEAPNGMLFLFNEPGYHTMWMKGMRFPLDIVWLRNSTVVDLEENVLPPAPENAAGVLPVYRPDAPADMVLEVMRGFAEAHRVRIGDRVGISFPGSTGIPAVGMVSEVAALSSQSSAPSSRDPAASPAVRFFVETLRKAPPQGKGFRIEKTLAATDTYKKHLISYRVGALSLSGVMNVPTSKAPASGFPVLILNHDFIGKDVYYPGRGSRREQDFFARRGYVTIHPDYRGYGNSSKDPNDHHDFYAGYAQDIVGLLDALKNAALPYLDLERIGMWGHSMGGGIASRVMVLRPEVKAYVLFAPISADVEDNFYELSKKEVEWLRQTYGWEREVYRKLSPLSYFADVSAPVQLHHGTEDFDVPILFSEKMFQTLRQFKKPVEFYRYPQEKHEFGDAWELAAERSLQFFDKYVRNQK